MAAIHKTMTALHQAGVIDDKIMRRFEKACLVRTRRTTRTVPKPSANDSQSPTSPSLITCK